MRKNRQRVEKTKLCVSIPTELLNECDLYVDNYSAFFTACLKNKLSSIQRKQMQQENADIIQISRTYDSNKTAVSSTLPQKTTLFNKDDEISDDEFDDLLKKFNEQRARKEQKYD